MKWTLPIFMFAFMIPHILHAEVHITEVAWMGTTSSQYSEWIELHNDGSSTVNLAGWKLYEGDGGALVFTFTKSIPANGYLLLERITASAPDAVPDVDDEAGSFGGGGLANTGEDLVLKDASGTLIEELDYLSGWPAGDATSKKTMQWNETKWITATATPKAAAEGAGDEEEEGEDTEENESDDEEVTDNYPIPKVSPNTPHIEFTVPSTIYKGVPYEYMVQPVLEYDYRISEGIMYWNFGDGTALTQQVLAPVRHVYEYAGIYTFSFRYTDPKHTDVVLKGTKKITVMSPAIAIRVIDGRALELKNTSTTEVDLSAWQVRTADTSLMIPELTILAAKATIIIPFNALGLTTIVDIALVDPSGSVVASTAKEILPVTHIRVSAIYNEEVGITPEVLVAHAAVGGETTVDQPIRSRTKTIVVGAVALFVIGLSILLERLMGRREYQEE